MRRRAGGGVIREHQKNEVEGERWSRKVGSRELGKWCHQGGGTEGEGG